MEQNLWLAAHQFSFWCRKLGGTVKKSPCRNEPLKVLFCSFNCYLGLIVFDPWDTNHLLACDQLSPSNSLQQIVKTEFHGVEILLKLTKRHRRRYQWKITYCNASISKRLAMQPTLNMCALNAHILRIRWMSRIEKVKYCNSASQFRHHLPFHSDIPTFE